MAKKEKKGVEEPTAPFWMTTYGDMVTLLMTFFILLLSAANMDKAKLGAAALSLRGALGALDGQPAMTKNLSTTVAGKDFDQKMDVYDAMLELEDTVEEMQMSDQVQLEVTDSGLLIRMGDQFMFSPGGATLKSDAFEVLKVIGKKLKTNATKVFVGGHTDNVPISNEDFDSNWELSGARALTVVRFLIDECNVQPGKLAAVGHGEFKPIDTNTTPEGRKKNRRVEFLVSWAKE